MARARTAAECLNQQFCKTQMTDGLRMWAKEYFRFTLHLSKEEEEEEETVIVRHCKDYIDSEHSKHVKINRVNDKQSKNMLKTK